MKGLVVLCVLGIFAAFVQSYTRVCEVADTKILFDLTFKVYELRVQCEDASFTGPYCSQYYMWAQRLLRAELSYEICKNFRSARFFEYAGTPNNSNSGVFYFEQNRQSFINNKTGNYLRGEIDTSFDDLIAEIENLWGEIRADLSTDITTQWSDTRTLAAQEEQENRDLDTSEEQQNQQLVTDTETANRATEDEQSSATQEYVSDTEEGNRADVEAQNAETREDDTEEETSTRADVDADSAALDALWSGETSHTIYNTTADASSSAAAYQANTYAQESADRTLISSGAAATQGARYADTQQTVALLDQTMGSSTSLYNSQEASVASNWGSLYAHIFSLLSQFQNSQNSSENTELVILMMHIHLQGNSWADSNGCIGINAFGPADVFTRPPYFMQLRSVTNNTIWFNQMMYGSSFSANYYWLEGESARNAGNLRTAAYYYSQAYFYAVTPPSEI